MLCSSKERTVEKSSFAKVSPSREVSVSVAVEVVDVCLASEHALVAVVNNKCWFGAGFFRAVAFLAQRQQYGSQ